MKRKQLPLNWYVMALTLVCWILPIILMLGAFVWYVNDNMKKSVLEMSTVSVENAARLSTVRLEEASNLALDASYNPALKNAWSEYNAARDEQSNKEFLQMTLSNTTRSFLSLKYGDNVNIAMSMVTYYTDDLFSVYYYDTSRYTYALRKSYQRADENGISAERYIQSRAPFETDDIHFFEIHGDLYLARNLVDINYKPYALLVLQLEQKAIFESFKNLSSVQSVTVAFGEAVIPVIGEPMDISAWPLALQADTDGTMQGNQLFLSGEKRFSRNEMQYYCTNDFELLWGQDITGFLLMGTIAVLAIIMMSAFMFTFFRRITRPLGLLAKASQRVEAGEFGAEVDVRQMRGAEMQYVGEQFNHMSNQLHRQFEQLYREELALRDARIMALQSQINPHFLGNTLEVINWEARLAGNVKVSAMLEALSTILEATMDRRHRSTILLSEELHYVNAYLTIITQRLGRRLTVERQIDETLLDEMVPRLVMQPILENAVEHGIGNHPYGTIIIRAHKEDENWMVLEVENDQPLTDKDAENIHRILSEDEAPTGTGSTRLGIRNVHQRLKIIYGEESGLAIKNDKNNHTVSSMRIRLVQPQQI